jgi:hypothetical protein
MLSPQWETPILHNSNHQSDYITYLYTHAKIDPNYPTTLPEQQPTKAQHKNPE